MLIHLDALGLSYSPTPLHLFDPDEEDEDSENLDDEQLLQTLSGMLAGVNFVSDGSLVAFLTLEKQNLWPKFRWKRSRWGRYCPVELASGNLVHGNIEFSVG